MRTGPRVFAVRVAAIVAGGVALRALYSFALARHVTGMGDWHFYHWQANLIAAGRGFLDPFALQNGEEIPSAGHPPLYPLALSVVSKLGGDGELAHRALGLVTGAAVIVAIALLARRAAGERAGVIAALLAAAYPVLVAADGALMSESLCGLLVAAALLACWRMIDQPSPRTAAAAGALVALAALTRSEAVLLMPALVLPLAGRAVGRSKQIAASLAAFAVVLAPWMVRNAVTFERFVPISTNDATVIAGANCPRTYRGIDIGGWNLDCISPRATKEESIQAARWRREGIRYARRHVSRWPVVAAARFLRAWDLYQPWRQVEFAEGRQQTVVKIGVVAFWLLVPLGAYGVLVLARRGVPVIVLVAPFLAVSFTAVTGYGAPKLRHMAEIPLVALAAAGIDALARRHPDRPAGSKALM